MLHQAIHYKTVLVIFTLVFQLNVKQTNKQIINDSSNNKDTTSKRGTDFFQC